MSKTTLETPDGSVISAQIWTVTFLGTGLVDGVLSTEPMVGPEVSGIVVEA